MRTGHRRTTTPGTAPPRRPDTTRPGDRRPRTPGAPGGSGAPARRMRRYPDPARPQQWFAQQLLLVLSGQRPVHALLGHARDTAYERLGTLAPAAPLRPRGTDRSAPVLRQVGACRPDSGVIEAFARITAGGRTRAVAFRLERTPAGRWQCCAVELDLLQRA